MNLSVVKNSFLLVGEVLLASLFPLVKKIYRFPNVMTIEETLKVILQERLSICRFGDGEFLLMLERRDLAFQYKDSNLALELRTVLKNTDTKVLVGLPIGFENVNSLIWRSRVFWKSRIVLLMPLLRGHLLKDARYANAHVTRIYFDFKDKRKSDLYFDLWSKLWSGRDIVIVEGEHSRLGYGNTLFQGAKSIKRILAPAHNAYSEMTKVYSFIAENLDKSSLILVALGPTATVLVHKLATIGFQAVDIGNLDIEFEWKLRKVRQKVRIPNKYTGEAIGGRNVDEIIGRSYLDQIIAGFGINKQSYPKLGLEVGFVLYGSTLDKRAKIAEVTQRLGGALTYLVNNHSGSCREDEIKGSNLSFEFSAYLDLLREFKGSGPFILVNDTIFRNHATSLWVQLLESGLHSGVRYPEILGDIRIEKVHFEEKDRKYLASWIFLIPDRVSLEVFIEVLDELISKKLNAPSSAYQHYIVDWLNRNSIFSGWHGPKDQQTLMRKELTVRLEHELSKRLVHRGIALSSFGRRSPIMYQVTRGYDRVKTRWMAVFYPNLYE